MSFSGKYLFRLVFTYVDINNIFDAGDPTTGTLTYFNYTLDDNSTKDLSDVYTRLGTNSNIAYPYYTNFRTPSGQDLYSIFAAKIIAATYNVEYKTFAIPNGGMLIQITGELNGGQSGTINFAYKLQNPTVYIVGGGGGGGSLEASDDSGAGGGGGGYITGVLPYTDITGITTSIGGGGGGDYPGSSTNLSVYLSSVNQGLIAKSYGGGNGGGGKGNGVPGGCGGGAGSYSNGSTQPGGVIPGVTVAGLTSSGYPGGMGDKQHNDRGAGGGGGGGLSQGGDGNSNNDGAGGAGGNGIVLPETTGAWGSYQVYVSGGGGGGAQYGKTGGIAQDGGGNGSSNTTSAPYITGYNAGNINSNPPCFGGGGGGCGTCGTSSQNGLAGGTGAPGVIFIELYSNNINWAAS
jgi:hypothetical protein